MLNAFLLIACFIPAICSSYSEIKKDNLIFSERKVEIVIAEKTDEEKHKEYRQQFGPLPEFFDAYYKAHQAFPNVPIEVIEAIHQIETGKSGDSCVKSYADAQGPMQFISSTWSKYGINGDSDDSVDICDANDAIMSAANYLNALYDDHGNIREMIYGYNHSWYYVDDQVLSVAREIGL